LPEIKVNEFRKKQGIYAKTTIIDITVVKEKKKVKKEIGNKEHIIKQA